MTLGVSPPEPIPCWQHGFKICGKLLQRYVSWNASELVDSWRHLDAKPDVWHRKLGVLLAVEGFLCPEHVAMPAQAFRFKNILPVL
eukprot:CAMPEP_0114121940 /NCGR_PEP_ID=MMETSP0043_2-20121206/7436_1 /TAXON_ID=464988 /ORGANISM="Hemiselmis andersenii, Strain CCMP644" /LENGTH=85 /DNA_ID=CAMNT_0001214635 /DNA_START=791 /DNA_END=1045 /DNA_ORIENTATION=-